MNSQIAIEIAKDRIRKNGAADENTSLFFKHVVLQPSEVVELNGDNQTYFLVDGNYTPMLNISIGSDNGEYNTEILTNEQVHEHRGKITITNQALTVNNVYFLVLQFNNRKASQDTDCAVQINNVTINNNNNQRNGNLGKNSVRRG